MERGGVWFPSTRPELERAGAEWERLQRSLNTAGSGARELNEAIFPNQPAMTTPTQTPIHPTTTRLNSQDTELRQELVAECDRAIEDLRRKKQKDDAERKVQLRLYCETDIADLIKEDQTSLDEVEEAIQDQKDLTELEKLEEREKQLNFSIRKRKQFVRDMANLVQHNDTELVEHDIASWKATQAVAAHGNIGLTQYGRATGAEAILSMRIRFAREEGCPVNRSFSDCPSNCPFAIRSAEREALQQHHHSRIRDLKQAQKKEMTQKVPSRLTRLEGNHMPWSHYFD